MSLACGDIKGYFAYNAMAFPVAVAFILELFHSIFGKYARIIHIFSTVIIMGNFVYFLYRL